MPAPDAPGPDRKAPAAMTKTPVALTLNAGSSSLKFALYDITGASCDGVALVL